MTSVCGDCESGCTDCDSIMLARGDFDHYAEVESDILYDYTRPIKEGMMKRLIRALNRMFGPVPQCTSRLYLGRQHYTTCQKHGDHVGMHKSLHMRWPNLRGR